MTTCRKTVLKCAPCHFRCILVQSIYVYIYIHIYTYVYEYVYRIVYIYIYTYELYTCTYIYIWTVYFYNVNVCLNRGITWIEHGKKESVVSPCWARWPGSNTKSTAGYCCYQSGQIITTSLRPHHKWWLVRGIIPKWALIQVREIL